MTKKIEDQIVIVRRELQELEDTFPDWPNQAAGLPGSQKFRAIAKRIVMSSKHLEALVRENTFSRP
jgi:hypothetical protein